MDLNCTLLTSFGNVLILVAGQAVSHAAESQDFMEVGDLTSQPIGHYELCRRIPEECAA